MHTVELTCDPALEAAVRGLWQRLSEGGVPSLAHNTHPSHRPHLTMASFGTMPVGAPALLNELLAAALPLPVRLTGLVSYSARSRRRVLSWAVVPTVELMVLHREVWRILSGAGEPNPFYLPGRWSPHVGLTRRVEPAELATAHEIVGRLPDVSGLFDAARSYDSESRTLLTLGVPEFDGVGLRVAERGE